MSPFDYRSDSRGGNVPRTNWPGCALGFPKPRKRNPLVVEAVRTHTAMLRNTTKLRRLEKAPIARDSGPDLTDLNSNLRKNFPDTSRMKWNALVSFMLLTKWAVSNARP